MVKTASKPKKPVIVELERLEQLEAELEQEEKIEKGGEIVKSEIGDIEIYEDKFDYNTVTEEVARKLRECKVNIYQNVVKNLETIVEIGTLFIQAQRLISHKLFRKWVEKEFENSDIQLPYHKINRMMIVAKGWHDYPEYREAMRKMQLSTIYKLFSSRTPEEVIDFVVEKVEQGEIVTQTDVQEIKQQVRQDYKKVLLEEAQVVNKAKNLLLQTSNAEDKKEVNTISKLSKEKQVQVATLIARGEAKTAKQAIKMVTKPRQEPIITYADILETKSQEETITKRYSSWKDIPNESIDLLIAECPLKYDFVVNPEGMDRLAAVAHNVLKPSGIMIATVGHKAIMEVGHHVSGLNTLHALCIRRQPGNSRGIIGINITSASIFAAMLYKSPFRPPAHMIVDFQTIDSESGILPDMDVIESGIEKCFERFITALFEEGQTLAHFEVSKNKQEQFGIRDYLETLAIKLKASEFIVD